MQLARWAILPIMCLSFLIGCGGGPACNGQMTSSGGGFHSFVCGPGGGGTGGPTIATVYVYTTDSSNTVHAAALTDGTTFAELTSLTLPTVAMQTYDMLVVSKKFLYISGISGANGEVFAYAIDSSTGALTPIAGNPVLTSTQAGFSMATDSQGRFLFVGDANGEVAAFTINATSGALTAVPNSPFLLDAATGLGVSWSLTVDNTGHFLYVGQGSGARSAGVFSVFGFNIDQTSGALSPISGEPFALGIGLIQSDSAAPYVLGTSDTIGDNHIYSVTVGSTGTLAPIVGATTLNAPHQIFVHPTGKFVYALEDGQFGGNTVEAFAIDSNGNPTLITGSPFTKTDSMTSCKIDQNGNWAFCPTSVSKVAVFGINTTTGALTSTITSLAIGDGTTIAVTD